MDKSLQNNSPQEQGKRLKSLRKLTHLSRRAFAVKHDMSPGSLQNWEDGRYHGLTLSAIEQLITAFSKESIECSSEWLLYGTPPAPQKTELDATKAQKSLPLISDELLKKTADNAEKYKLNSKLYNATIAGRYAEIENLIIHGKSKFHTLSGIALHLYDVHENTLLHVAAKNGNLKIAEFFIQHGAQVNARNKRKQTPLHLAIYDGHYDLVECLIKNGASIDVAEDEGGTPLSWAAYTGQLEIAKQLLSHGANIHTADQNTNTPLHWACYQGRLEMIKFLILKGADIEKTNSNGLTPLDFAIENGHVETVEFFLAQKNNKT